MNISIKFAEPLLQVPLENYKFLSNFKTTIIIIIIIIIIILSKVPFHIKLVYHQTIMYLHMLLQVSGFHQDEIIPKD